MKWIKCSDRKPDTDHLVYVTNVRRGCDAFVATYFKDQDCFIEFDLERHRVSPSIDVTHWILLPVPPIIWADGSTSGGEVE